MPIVKVERSVWLKEGVNRFSIMGLEGLNVEKIAKQLSCNKSSFYWHFKSKENYLKEVINYWFENSIKPVANEVESESDPGNRFVKFLQLSFQDKSRKDFMFHLRKLAQSDVQLMKLLNHLTESRITYTTSLIGQLGYSQEEAAQKAEVLFNFYLGWYERNKYKSSNNQEDIAQAINLIRTIIKF